MNPEERPFLEAIRRNPAEAAAYRQYADWLEKEDSADPRIAYLRLHQRIVNTRCAIRDLEKLIEDMEVHAGLLATKVCNAKWVVCASGWVSLELVSVPDGDSQSSSQIGRLIQEVGEMGKEKAPLRLLAMKVGEQWGIRPDLAREKAQALVSRFAALGVVAKINEYPFPSDDEDVRQVYLPGSEETGL